MNLKSIKKFTLRTLYECFASKCTRILLKMVIFQENHQNKHIKTAITGRPMEIGFSRSDFWNLREKLGRVCMHIFS